MSSRRADAWRDKKGRGVTQAPYSGALQWICRNITPERQDIMKTRTTIFAATVVIATLAAAGAALAHPGGMGYGMGPGMQQGMGPGMMGHGMGPGMGMRGMQGPQTAAALGTRLTETKGALKITAAQEAAWNAYAAVVTRQADARANMHTQMQGKMHDPSTSLPDRAAWQETMAKFHLEMQAGRAAALKDLYAVLTPEQKTLADQTLPGMGGQRMAGAMGGPMGRHGGWGMSR